MPFTKPELYRQGLFILQQRDGHSLKELASALGISIKQATNAQRRTLFFIHVRLNERHTYASISAAPDVEPSQVEVGHPTLDNLSSLREELDSRTHGTADYSRAWGIPSPAEREALTKAHRLALLKVRSPDTASLLEWLSSLANTLSTESTLTRTFAELAQQFPCLSSASSNVFLYPELAIAVRQIQHATGLPIQIKRLTKPQRVEFCVR